MLSSLAVGKVALCCVTDAYIHSTSTCNPPDLRWCNPTSHPQQTFSSRPFSPHPNRSPRLRRRRAASLRAALPPPGGKGQYVTGVLEQGFYRNVVPLLRQPVLRLGHCGT